MALPCGTTGSLCPTFVPGRDVSLAVRLPYAIALFRRLPTVVREPWKASVTLLEATTPVKLPTKHCLLKGLDSQQIKGGISLVDSTIPNETASKSSTYSTHHLSEINVKL